MNSDTFPLIIFLALVGVVAAIYTVAVRNELARRLQRLRALAANVAAARQNRQGVGRDAVRHVSHAQRHEQRVVSYGSRRGRGGGKLISDVGNGWPAAGTTGISGQAMSMDSQSRDAENAARLALHEEASRYNEIVTSWPSCIVAEACGFRPWQFRPRGARWMKSARRR